MSRLARLRWRLRGDPPRPWRAILFAAAAMALVAYLAVKLSLLARSTLAVYGLVGGAIVGWAEERLDRALLHAGLASGLLLPLQVALFAVDDLVIAARYGVLAPPMTLLPADTASRVFVFVVFETYVGVLVAVPALLGALVGAAVVLKARQLLGQA
ncbi:MAG: hypothetical protein ABEH77_08355 [Halobacteriaceae archaeon]